MRIIIIIHIIVINIKSDLNAWIIVIVSWNDVGKCAEQLMSS